MVSSLDDRDNIVDHVVCLKAEFLRHTLLSNENGEFYTYGIYPYLNRSVCFFFMNPSRDESVETGNESVEARDESIEAAEKHNNHHIIHIILCSDDFCLYQ